MGARTMNLVIQKTGGKEYVSFRESFWDPVRKKTSSRTVRNFGRLDLLLAQDPEALDKLRAQAEELKKAHQESKNALLQERVKEALSVKARGASTGDSRTVMLGPSVYRQIWERLAMPRKLRDLQSQGNTRFDFPNAVFYMVAARSLMPDSKLAQWERRNRFLYGSDKLRLCHLYRAIDLLCANKEQLVAYMNRQIAKQYKRAVTVALYDVTTYWFESQDADTLRNFGFSKDNKVNQVQVVMGLLIDQNGIPIDYEIFPGNTSEFSTMLPLLRKLKDTYGIERVVVTADRGLNSGANLYALREMGLEYVIAYRLRSNAGKMLPLIRDSEGWTVRHSSVRTDVSKFRVTEETRRVRVTDESTGRPKFVDITSKLLLNYSERRARKDAHDRSRLIAKAERYAEHPGLLKSDLRRGGKSYLKLKEGDLGASLDTERIEEAEAFDGYYGICYSDPNMTPDEVLRIHHSLWQIEESFRISKSLLEARPCFHWTESRIRGHFLICYIALVIHRLLETELAAADESITAERIIEALSEATLTEVQLPDGEKFYTKSNTEGDFETIARMVGLKPLPGLASEADVKLALRVKAL